jgi:hypothetical protein
MDNTEQLMSLLPLILGFLLLGIVALIGLLVWAFTRRRGAGTGQPTAAEEAPTSPPASGSRAPYYLLGVKPGETGAWEVYVQGMRYTSLAAVPDARIRAAVVQAVEQAVKFAGQAPDLPQSSGDASPQAAAVAQRAPSARPAVERADLPTRRSTPQGGLLPVINFAHEITDIIEELQRESPALQTHAVSLQNTPGGGINFLVDGKLYTELEEIPFPEMRTLIRKATQAWEAQQ